MKLYDIQTKSEIPLPGRRNNPKKRVHQPASDLNPMEWSKWLYEIRQQLGRGTSRAEAYEDCRQHYEAHLNSPEKAPQSPT